MKRLRRLSPVCHIFSLKLPDVGSRGRRLTLRSATGTAQRAVPTNWQTRFFAVAWLVFTTVAVLGQETNNLSDAEIQGRALAQKILQQWPDENSTNTGTLQIKGQNGKRLHLPLTCIVSVNSADDTWSTRYQVQTASNSSDILMVTHSLTEPNRYVLYCGGDETANLLADASGPERLNQSFAGSDFSVGDLGLEFFHWPKQKVLKREVHRSCGCTVLESTNPSPTPGGYSRVVSWIDTDSLGIVEAYAYDAKGKELKDFYPKDLKKVNGRYEVQTMVMENDQADTRTRLEFDLDK